MKSVIIVALLGLICVESAVYFERVETVDGKCKIVRENGNTMRNDGEEWQGEGCIKHYCDAERGVVQGIGCGRISKPPIGCRMVQGEGDHPNCCEKMVCDGSSKSY